MSKVKIEPVLHAVFDTVQHDMPMANLGSVSSCAPPLSSPKAKQRNEGQLPAPQIGSKIGIYATKRAILLTR